ncbi:MAG TPA: FAD-binding oxidoreductase [Candidatus Saccharimonadales bacterium]|nr:FAD-binding oxidoreductase [Candidatus Saccharimonadales bacterium]
MSKVAHYLQEHLVGEVMTGTDARRYFATDASIFVKPPALVVYPRNENDVRKTARFSWQLAERGRVIPITSRGSGTDQTGAAIGEGIMLVFPAHMNRILELDTKNNTVTVEPGINYAKLQQTLHTHGRFLPPYPASAEYSTIGGAIGNNASGEKTIKYGDTRPYVQSLRVVLANGEVIETKRLNKRELSKKLGLATFEGEIYRSIDTLLEEQRELIERTRLPVTKNNAGYDLLDIRKKDGSFDLTPLIVGSQGTLGIVTEAVMETEAHNPQTTLMLATFDSLEHTQAAVLNLRELSDSPSVLELIDGNLLERVQAQNPNFLSEVLKPPFPQTVLLIEFDNAAKDQKKAVKRAEKILQQYASSQQTATEPDGQQLLWKVRQASSAVLAHNEGLVKAVPVINDVAVPPDQLRPYMENTQKLMQAAGLPVAIWGHAGDGNFHVQPQLNLGQVGDRQKAFRLIEEYYRMVVGLGGTIAAEAGDGRMNAPYLEALYGPEIYAILQKVKQIFDPYGTLNPGVKFGSSIDDLKAQIRTDFGLNHIYDHLPRS